MHYFDHFLASRYLNKFPIHVAWFVTWFDVCDKFIFNQFTSVLPGLAAPQVAWQEVRWVQKWSDNTRRVVETFEVIAFYLVSVITYSHCGLQPVQCITFNIVEWLQSNVNFCQLQEHSKSTDLCQGESDPESRYGSGVQFQTPDDFENSIGTFLFKVTFVVKFSLRSDQFVQRLYMRQLRKNAASHNVEESFKEFQDPYPEADHVQNVISSSLCTDTLW